MATITLVNDLGYIMRRWHHVDPMNPSRHVGSQSAGWRVTRTEHDPKGEKYPDVVHVVAIIAPKAGWYIDAKPDLVTSAELADRTDAHEKGRGFLANAEDGGRPYTMGRAADDSGEAAE